MHNFEDVSLSMDTKLIQFTCYTGIQTYVKFRYDLTKNQIKAIAEATDNRQCYLDHKGDFIQWIKAVIAKAQSSSLWGEAEHENDWNFWNPDPCLKVYK